MGIKQKYTMVEFFSNRKILIKDLNKLSPENLFKLSLDNQILIDGLMNYSQAKHHFLENNIIVHTNSEKVISLLSQKIKFINLTILVSAILNILFKKGEISCEHHKIFQNLLKDETLYHIELQDSNNNFFKDFIINRNPTQMNIELSDFSKYLKFTFYHFERELQELELKDLNHLLYKISHYQFHVQKINLN